MNEKHFSIENWKWLFELNDSIIEEGKEWVLAVVNKWIRRRHFFIKWNKKEFVLEIFAILTRMSGTLYHIEHATYTVQQSHLCKKNIAFFSFVKDDK